MNRPGRKLAAGWSFAAGTLFGVLAAFVLPTALHGSRVAAPASEAGAANVINDVAAPAGDLNAAVIPAPRQSAAAKPADAKRSAPTDKKANTHSELELQLD